jgi:hypothetical protein
LKKKSSVRRKWNALIQNKAKERKKKRMDQKEMEKEQSFFVMVIFCVAIVIEKKNELQHIGYRCCSTD